MTVQELIDELNKVEDKTKIVKMACFDGGDDEVYSCEEEPISPVVFLYNL